MFLCLFLSPLVTTLSLSLSPLSLFTCPSSCSLIPLACSSLVGGVTDATPPSPLIVTNCMTPPQAYWMRYAQTELVDVSTCMLFPSSLLPPFIEKEREREEEGGGDRE